MTVSIAAVMVAAATAAAKVGDDPLPRLGTNLDSVNDWGTMLPFADLFKTSRPWISGNAATFEWDDGRPLDLDAEGWVRSLLPNQIARTLMLVDDTTLEVGSGRWVVRYEGSGTLQYVHGATVISQSPGRDLIEVHPMAGGGIFMYLVATDPEDPLRRIRVLREEHADLASPPRFAPAFLERVASYRVVRFMEWARSNDTDLASWADRPMPSDARWSGREGVPLEVMIDLADEICAEPWFCVPHLADEAFISEMATLIHERLAPGRRVWVEHSNEVWNGIFPQAAHAQAEGLAQNLSDDPWQAAWRWHSRRSVRIFEIFAEVFGDERPLVRTMGGFVAVPWGNEQALSFEDAHLVTDALAIAPYFGGEWGGDERLEETRAMDAAELLAAIRAESLPWAIEMSGQNRTLAQGFGVELVAYEGGHHLAAPQLPASDPVHALFHEVVRHPEMGEIYGDFLAAWDDLGGGTFVNFTFCGRFSHFGAWSVLEWITQPTTPREAALLAHAGGETVSPCGVPCPADLDGNGIVAGADLGQMLVAWGPVVDGAIAADLDGDGVVGGADLGQLLLAWGMCPR
ncbi:MAG: hypothetical protein ACYTFH_04135 [Planctomycetota bacterium]